MEYCTCHVAGCCGGISKTLYQKIFRRTCTGQSCKMGMSPQNRGRIWRHRDAVSSARNSYLSHFWLAAFLFQQFRVSSAKSENAPRSFQTAFQGLIYAPIFQKLSICLQWMWEAWGRCITIILNSFYPWIGRDNSRNALFLQFYCGKIQLYYGPALRICF